MKLKKLQTKIIRTSINAHIKEGFCPVCQEKLVEFWNEQDTHKYQICPTNSQHHTQLVDYHKDQD